MKRFKYNFQNFLLGFTLIEMIVVVMVLGILVSITIPRFYKAVEKSRAAEAMTILGKMCSGYKTMVIDGILDESTYDAFNAYLTNGTAWKCALLAADDKWNQLGFDKNPNVDNPNLDFCYNFWAKASNPGAQCPNIAALLSNSLPHNVVIARRKLHPGTVPTSTADCDCNRFIIIDCVTGNVTKSEEWY